MSARGLATRGYLARAVGLGTRGYVDVGGVVPPPADFSPSVRAPTLASRALLRSDGATALFQRSRGPSRVLVVRRG